MIQEPVNDNPFHLDNHQ